MSASKASLNPVGDNSETSDMVKPSVSGHRLIPRDLSEDPTEWTRRNVQTFLKHNQLKYDLDDNDIKAFEERKVAGSTFLRLTRERLCQKPYNLEDGAADVIEQLIDALKKSQAVTQTTLPQGLEELHRLRKIVEEFKNPFHVFNLIVHPKTKTSITWAVDINTATLGMLGTRICEEYSEYKGSVLLFIFKQSNNQTHHLQTNEELQRLLRSLVAHGQMTVKITVITPAKPFSDWTLKEVWELYEIDSNVKADLLYFPRLECQHIPLNNDAILPLMIDTLQRLYRTTPLFLGAPEATRSLYVHSILNITIDLIFSSTCDFVIRPEQFLEGTYGRGPVDYAIETRGGVTVGVTEVKRDDFSKGVAQNTVQVEAVLPNRKRKAPIDDTENEPITRFGIITDAETWRFLECTRGDDDKPKFRLSCEYKVSYGKQSTPEDVQKITAIVEVIKWLLTEALKASTTAASAAPPDLRKRQKLVEGAAHSG